MASERCEARTGKEADVHSRNVVALIGRLSAEPVLRATPSGTSVLEFGLAVNRSNRKDDGSFEDSLDGFFDCEVFGLLAEVLSEKLRKGTEIQVCGSLIQNRFEAKSGQKVSKVIVRAKTVALVPVLPKRDKQGATKEPVGAVA